jgi:hypothetical protein
MAVGGCHASCGHASAGIEQPLFPCSVGAYSYTRTGSVVPWFSVLASWFCRRV